jgi:NADP-dependent 3-hydroxy acid dehydrogenase YdfG
MKLAITGHTQGIGKAIAELYPDYIGFSRSNGYDISVDDNLEKIITQSQDCDVFINNAYSGDAQTKVFSMLYELWRNDPNKTIVNIVSRAQYDTHYHREYSNHKRELAKIANPGFMYDRKCRIINLSPGLVSSQRVPQAWLEKQDLPYITSEQCAGYVKWALEQDLEIGELSFWKSK